MKGKYMYKILIDATDRYNKKVSLDKDGVVMDAVVGDIDIVAMISYLLEKNVINLSDISEFISKSGEGSFTGLKIGATIANVLNWALGKKPLSELEYPDYGRAPNITPRPVPHK
jgi:hypothetical protein